MAIFGSFGNSISAFNHQFFGYLSYLYTFVAFGVLFYIYRHGGFNFRRVELSLAGTLIFFAMLMFQSLVVTSDMRGEIASDFVDFLMPYIGTFGLWVFLIIITSVASTIIADKNIHDVIDIVKYKINSKLLANKKLRESKKVAETKYVEEKSYKEDKNINDNIKETPYVKKEKPVEKNYEEETIYEDQLDEPAFLRHENNNKINFNRRTSSDQVEEISKTKDKSVHIDKKPEKPSNILEQVESIKMGKKATVVEELEENKKLLDQIEVGKVEKPKDFILPKIEFLQKSNGKTGAIDEREIDTKIRDLIEKLRHFKIDGDVIRTYTGPVVSTFEFKPAANIKVSKILNLQDDLAMALRAQTIRIQAPIPGKDVVGIEIPNHSVDTIYLREIFESKLFQEASSPLTIALGKDIVGNPFITDLKKLPHLLIAGTTGSGKSVGINSMILSLLYKNSPDDLKLLMIDPKMLEFSIYNDIPHLLTPVITKAKQAIVALSNMVYEMERRYLLMSEAKVKNIENYNEKIKKHGGDKFPYIVVIIDELADLMMTSGKDVEHSIARLAQMARASGIHLIVATQRPSVDVVTGLIKANLPSRISYRVGQKIDSKIILDQMGAESLLGRGDMLFTPPGSVGLVRLHAPWSTEEEIEEIVDFIKSQREAVYDKSFLQEASEESKSKTDNSEAFAEDLDELYEEAKSIIYSDKKTSISYLQRKLQIGYNRSARVIEQLENQGVLSAPNAKGIREIL